MTGPAPRAHFAGHGLVIDSEIPLALREREDTGKPADLILRWGDTREIGRTRPDGALLAEILGDDGTPYFSFARTDEGVVLRYPELCEFVGDGRLQRVRVDPHPGADRKLVSVLGSGALLAIHLALRGELVLHASCVEVDSGALAFVGASGMGKSTMAALMASAGCPLVSDDVLRTTLSRASGAHVYSGGVEGRLRDRARELASVVQGATTSETADGRLSLRPLLTSSDTLPLRACVIPRPDRENVDLAVRRLGAADALRRLLQFPRVVGWSDPRILRAQFEAAADLAASVPIFDADVPWGPPFADTLPRQLVNAVGFR